MSILRRIGAATRRFVGDQSDSQLGVVAVLVGTLAVLAAALASRDIAER